MENIQETFFKHFKEKIWRKVEGSETVADGYSFRGKRVFKKAWDGLKTHFLKGIPYEKMVSSIKPLMLGKQELEWKQMLKSKKRETEVLQN